MSSSSTRVVPLAEEETPDDTPNARRASVAAGATIKDQLSSAQAAGRLRRRVISGPALSLGSVMIAAGAVTWIAAPPGVYFVGMLGVTMIYAGAVAMLVAMLPTVAALSSSPVCTYTFSPLSIHP